MIRRLRDSLRVLLGRRRFEAELTEELEAHLEMQTADLVKRGIPEPEARRRARAAFGALDAAKDAARAARGVRWFDELTQDLRYAFRTLRKSPAYAAVAVATLALGIGANTAIFSLVDGVLLKPLPFPESERLVHITIGYPLGSIWTYRKEATSYSAVAAYEYGGELNLFAGGVPERIKGRTVSTEFFSVLGVTPLLGRTFRAGEDAPGAAPVAVISEALWRRRFGGARSLVGQSIMIDGTPREVVGVLPRSFAFPTVGTDVWVPVKLDPQLVASVWGGGVTLIGRLKPGITLAQADAEHRALIPRVRSSPPFKLPDIWGMSEQNHLRYLDAQIGRRVKGRLSLLLAAVGLVLLIACVNVANLNLTRLAARGREIALRQALGGSRLRVARQLLVEQLVIAAIGGAVGVVTALAILPALVHRLPPDTPRLDEVRIDPRVLGFTALAIVLAALLASLGPLLRLPRAGKSEVLLGGTRGSSAGPERHRLLRTLVGSEVALAVVLVIGALLLGRSLSRLLAVDPGLQVERLVTARVTPDPFFCKEQAGPCKCDTAAVRRSAGPAVPCQGFLPALDERLATVPGVTGVAMGTTIPLDGGFYTVPMTVEDHPIPPGQPAFLLGAHTVNPGYFRTLGIPLLRGRDFTAADRTGVEDVAIVSRSLAERFWPGQSAIGKHLKPVWFTQDMVIVGVVGDARYDGLSAEPTQDFYMPLAQFGVSGVTVALRSALSVDELERTLRREVAAVDPTATVNQVRSMEEVVRASVAQPRTTTTLIGAFAGLALLLGAIGVYGVLSYGVSQRRREIGIRMAVGAAPRAVQRLVLGEAARLLIGGVLAGLGAAWLATSLLKGFVFGVSVRDPLTFLAVPVLFALVGGLASYLPARRAVRVSPVEVMREE